MLRVVVAVKQVAALDDEFELEPGAVEVDPDFVERELNEWDAFSVEAAVQIKESDGSEAEVVVVTVGDEQADEVLVDCLARGADRAVRVDLAADDPLQVARALAAVVERESADLVLCGVQSSDAAAQATGVAVAAYAGLPHVAVARRIEFDAAARRLRADRELEGGLVEQVELPAPVLVTVQTGANEPRYATLRAIKQAAGKPREVVSAEDLGLDAPTLAATRGARVTELSLPQATGRAQMLEGDADDVAAAIVEIVRERIGAPA